MMRNFSLPPITGEYDQEPHGWKISSFFGTLVDSKSLDTREDAGLSMH